MTSLVIVDGDAPGDTGNSKVAYWDRLDVPPSHQSIPRLVDENIERLRKEYLAWVHELGEYSILKKTVREHLHLDDDFSFWWMTTIAEKAPMKSSGVYTVLKLRALELFVESSGFERISLWSRDKELHKVISVWCKSKGYSYSWKRIHSKRNDTTLRAWFNKLPHPIQGVASFIRFIWQRRRHVRYITGNCFFAECQASIVSYFPNIDVKLAKKNIFRSRYWEKLHDTLEDNNRKINWILLFEPNKYYSFADAKKLAERFEKESGGRAKFFFIEEFISTSTILKTLALWLCLVWRSIFLSSVKHAFVLTGSNVNFWSILEWEWHSSLRGNNAMVNLLKTTAFNNMAERMPKQGWGLFLWENQPWERILINSWRKNSDNGPIIGVQHVTVRYLNFRFFEDKRSYSIRSYPPLLPDFVAVNGRKAFTLLLEEGFPTKRMLFVEALRFLYLCEIEKPRSKPEKEHILLVVLPYIPQEARTQLRLLNKAWALSNGLPFSQIFIKPHPNTPVEEIVTDEVPGLPTEIVNDHLSDLWQKVRVVFCANSTSVALEAAMLGLPLVIIKPQNSLNLSILMSEPRIEFVSNAKELRDFLANPRPGIISDEYFFLDSSIPRWKKLLAKLDSETQPINNYQ